MSLKQLSRLTGFSVSTISKAFSMKSEIPEKTREIIFAEAKRIGVYEKYKKEDRGIPTVAVIVPEFKSEYYTGIISALSAALSRRGYCLISAESGFNAEHVAQLFSHFAYSLKVSGIIVFDNTEKIKNPDKFPALSISLTDSKPLYDFVFVSLSEALCTLVDYLFSNGHRRIAFIGERLTVSKREAFVRAMEKRGLYADKRLIKTVSSRFEDAGYDAMSAVLSEGEPPSAVIAAYDYIAIGALKAIEEHGLKVPDDISIVGIDNISAGKSLATPLTSVAVFSESDIEAIINMLMKKIENKNLSIKSASPSAPLLVERKSVKKIKP